MFESSSERIVDTLDNPLEELWINVLADGFSSRIGLRAETITTYSYYHLKLYNLIITHYLKATDLAYLLGIKWFD